MDAIGRGIKAFGGKNCFYKIRRAFGEMNQMIEQNKTQEINDRLKTQFVTVKNNHEKYSFFEDIAYKLSDFIQEHGLI